MNITPFLDEVYSFRLIFSNNFEVSERIEEIESRISTNKDKIKILSAISPGQIIPKDNVPDSLEWLNNEVNKILNSIEEDIIEKYRLELYLKFLDENSTEEKL